MDLIPSILLSRFVLSFSRGARVAILALAELSEMMAGGSAQCDDPDFGAAVKEALRYFGRS